MEEKLLTIASKPVYGPLPQSPALSSGRTALNFTVLPAVTPAGEPTSALFAALLLPGRCADIYGGRAAGAVEIVAVDGATGEVYHNSAERGHAAPISAVMHPDPKPAKPGQATVDSIELYFAVDLRAQLQLPRRSSRFSVFLWLDEMTSTPRQVQLPEPSEDVVSPAPDSNIITFRPVEGKPIAPPSGIALRESAWLLTGEIGSGQLSQLPGSSVPKYLTLLALDYRSRAFGWRSVALPRGAGSGRNLSFQLSRSDLIAGPGWLDAPQPPRIAFVLAALDGTLSPVLVLSA